MRTGEFDGVQNMWFSAAYAWWGEGDDQAGGRVTGAHVVTAGNTWAVPSWVLFVRATDRVAEAAAGVEGCPEQYSFTVLHGAR